MPTLILSFYGAVLAFRYVLRYLNLRHLKAHGDEVPPEFTGQIDPEVLRKTSNYTLEQNRVGLLESLVDSALLVVFLFGGLLGAYDNWVASVSSSFVWAGVLFFLGIQWAKTLVGIPFDLHSTFRLEARYGFNTTTPRLWVTDFVKAQVIGSVLIAVLAGCALALVRWSPERWWVWVWVFFLGFSVLLMYVSPYVIEPLFFKFEPVSEEGLEDEIRELTGRAGLQVSRVFQVDASRRSRHSNAYFTGIGKVKRIVLFDTLLQQMSHGEILAVLAHEVGHWKKRHILKRLALTGATALVALFAAHRLAVWEALPGLVGLGEASFYGRAVILWFLGSIVLFPVAPLFHALSRRDEREADRYATALTGLPRALASALVKLSRENLANLHPHPLYAAFYYSHPPVVERIRSLLTPAEESGKAGPA